MKRASTRFWLYASAFLFATAAEVVWAQSTAPRAEAISGRSNEVTLARLRPGRSTFVQVEELYPTVYWVRRIGTMWLTDPCKGLTMMVDTELGKEINAIRIEPTEGSEEECPENRDWYWGTGDGLKVGDTKTKVYSIYGEPNSVSPSTKNGQPLELLHYVFDWAGPDVPQVMEVVCTAPKDGTPGRVVEITLAAGTL